MTPHPGLAALARPSGAFAMVALDQRESLRAMLEAASAGDPSPGALAGFKVEATRALSPAASAVLLDIDTGLGPVLGAGALAPGCGLIVAADRLHQPRGGPVGATELDTRPFADPEVVARADAFKLLVIWQPDTGREARRRIVDAFVEACRRAGRPAIVEGIVRRATGTAAVGPDHPARVLDAALELSPGADLYKAEVPTLGAGTAGEIVEASRRMTDALGCPWVVLSNGVPPERFDEAVEAACRGGASGFLAGRAIWSASLGAADVRQHLETVAAPRLRSLAALVDRGARPYDDPGVDHAHREPADRPAVRRLTFIHTVAGLVPLFDDLARELIPDARVRHIVDASLLGDTIEAGHVEAPVARRLERQVGSELDRGSDLVVVTCSSMGGVVDAIAERNDWPVLRIDEAMADRALELGDRIGVLATLPTALEPTVELVRRRAGDRRVEIVARLAEGAFEALRTGNADRHEAEVREALLALLPEVDVVVLAQASMARVAATLGDEAASVPILASPRLGVERAAVTLLSGRRG